VASIGHIYWVRSKVIGHIYKLQSFNFNRAEIKAVCLSVWHASSLLLGSAMSKCSVPPSRHVEYSIFSYSSPSLKFTIFLYLSPTRHFDIADPSSKQDACHHELSKYDLCSPRDSQ